MSSQKPNIWKPIIAIVSPAVIGAGAVCLSVFYFEAYTFSLFVALPVFLGFCTTTIYSMEGDKGLGRSFLVSLASILVIAFILLITAAEGLVCLAMSLPLAIPLIFLGTVLAWAIARERRRKTVIGMSALMISVLPFTAWFRKQVQV